MLAMPGCITITPYHEVFVKIDIDIASMSISKRVTSKPSN